MVELDRLVIYQTHLTQAYTDSLVECLDQPEKPNSALPILPAAGGLVGVGRRA